jgi:hypothetical protein
MSFVIVSPQELPFKQWVCCFFLYKLTYKRTDDDKASLFSCMGLTFNTKYEPKIWAEYFAVQLTEEDLVTFLKLFKIESHTNDPMMDLRF